MEFQGTSLSDPSPQRSFCFIPLANEAARRATTNCVTAESTHLPSFPEISAILQNSDILSNNQMKSALQA